MTHTGDPSGPMPSVMLAMLPVGLDGGAAWATHVAVTAGDWCDPAVWRDGQVPDAGARVHIPGGVSVGYRAATEDRLDVIRVDGALRIEAERGRSTRMVVGAIVTARRAALEIVADAPDAGPVDVVFAAGAAWRLKNKGDRRTPWEPLPKPGPMPSGLGAAGSVRIRGRFVEAAAQLLDGPPAGAVQLVFAQPLDDPGWRVGQTLVIGGTARNASGARATVGGGTPVQDEHRTITGIAAMDGRMIVTIDRPLAFDHSGPQDPGSGQRLTGFVGNLSRTVRLSGGSVWLSHGDASSIVNTSIIGTGDGPGHPALIVTEARPVPVAERDPFYQGAFIEGNAVLGASGDGIVQRSCAAVLQGNVVSGVAGAAFVAERGDETGRWQDNLAIDVGASGFRVRSQALDVIDNVAQGTGAAAFAIQAADGPLRVVDTIAEGVPRDPALTQERRVAQHLPLTGFTGNEAIAVPEGLRLGIGETIGSLRSCVRDFTAWAVAGAGVSVSGPGACGVETALLLASGPAMRGGPPRSALDFSEASGEITVRAVHVEGFDHAVTSPSAPGGVGASLMTGLTHDRIGGAVHRVLGHPLGRRPTEGFAVAGPHTGPATDTTAGNAARDGGLERPDDQGAGSFVCENGNDSEIIDFDEGMDAIDFMIDSFGFKDLEVLRDTGEDRAGLCGPATLRLVAIDGSGGTDVPQRT